MPLFKHRQYQIINDVQLIVHLLIIIFESLEPQTPNYLILKLSQMSKVFQICSQQERVIPNLTYIWKINPKCEEES